MPCVLARTVRFSATLALALALSGCMVGPDYQPPDPQMAAGFRAGSGLAPASGPQIDLTSWWRGFGDPMLDKVVDQALAENLDLAQAVARVRQARAAVAIARAALLPSGALNGSAATAHQSVETPIGQIQNALGVDRDGNLYDLGAGASWDADIFGGLRRGQQAALADYQAADAGAAAARVAVVAEAADTYIQLRTLQARLAIVREQAGTQRQLLDLARLQYARGLLAEADLREAQSTCARIEAQVPPLESALETATNTLEVLMGAVPGSWHGALAAPSAIPAPPAIASAEGPASLLRRRPDIIIAERRLAAANARIGTAIAEYYPHFSLSALLGFSSTSAASLLGSGGAQAQAIAGVRWRLFDFGRVDAEVAAARGHYGEALAAYRLAVLQATADVENAFTSLAKSQAQAQLLRASEDSFGRRWQIVRTAEARGVVSRVEVLQSTGRLLQARDARVTAQSDAARAAVLSFRALGGGWQS
ncbi:efflux transporter outer membrane subunit [Novosphingobium album (ex Liu et al. 2023)]|uniref:Efflux transporter outer membrane subunit n=1 Tax=Novosphingobium album (ex Liu et al. 2023) TaxID=3031130 RepID=A0ABT5WLU7_9SPHN|nr:efflux transporter outer membrane subunit [Novosphingobium album (ex Liu et al. 2023)]MDE8651000.1 efflux transporter outer membrane subunit [Novosphingobium album (ex Liu et al. 2023)]